MEGTQWSVFEPNDEKLWIQLRIAASNFLTRVWSDGALFGSTPAQAFYVKCDAETNPPEVIEAGQVICEIGIAPVKPAEFVDLPPEPVQRRRRLVRQRVVQSLTERKERPACRPMTRKHTSRSGSP